MTDDERNLCYGADIVGIKRTHAAGTGLFANSEIPEGTELECAVAVPIFNREKYILDATVIWEYYFVSREEMLDPRIAGYLVFGVSSICNHSPVPNAKISWVENDDIVWAVLSSIKTIPPDEEITIWYHNIDEYVSYGLITPAQAYGRDGMGTQVPGMIAAN